MNTYRPQSITSPGETLSEKLSEMGMSIEIFAVKISEPTEVVKGIMQGTCSITVSMAKSFEKVTHIPSHFWMERQRLYDRSRTRHRFHKTAAMA